MLANQVKFLWINGKIVNWGDATIHVTAHSLHLGSGIFEALRSYETSDGPAVFRMDAHLERLLSSAAIYDIDIPYTQKALGQAVCEIIKSNGFSNCYVRLICYFGAGSLGMYPYDCPTELAIVAWPFWTCYGPDALKGGISVLVSSWVKFDSTMIPTTAKSCGQYVNSILAIRQAMRKGCQEAILLNSEGSIAEASGENLFIIHDGVLLTNDERSSILPGITRDSVIQIAHDLGLKVEIVPLCLGDLMEADEAFLTGTAAEITPIRDVEGKPIGLKTPGPVTEKLQEAFFASTDGTNQKYRYWLHFINRKMA